MDYFSRSLLKKLFNHGFNTGLAVMFFCYMVTKKIEFGLANWICLV